MLVNAPIPADFEVLSTDQNNPLTALAADGHTLIQGEPFALCTAGGAGTLDYYDTKNVDGDIDGDGLQGWDGGSHLSALGGTIRLGELVPGSSIDHALQIDVDAPNLYKGTAATCWVPPASRCDIYGPTSYGGTNPSLAMGALLALPPTLDLDSLGLDAPGLILAKAFQDYGAYIANDASRSVNNIVTELSPSGSVAGVYDANGSSGNPGPVPDGLGCAVRHRRSKWHGRLVARHRDHLRQSPDRHQQCCWRLDRRWRNATCAVRAAALAPSPSQR